VQSMIGIMAGFFVGLVGHPVRPHRLKHVRWDKVQSMIGIMAGFFVGLVGHPVRPHRLKHVRWDSSVNKVTDWV
jgi:hypothetical protein